MAASEAVAAAEEEEMVGLSEAVVLTGTGATARAGIGPRMELVATVTSPGWILMLG